MLDKMNEYIIPQGDHYSNLINSIDPIATVPGVHNGTIKMTGSFIIPESCRYTLTNPECINDTNKLVGFGYGLWPWSHQLNSARIGWRVSSRGKLLLSLYVYNNGKRIIVPIQESGRNVVFKFGAQYNFVLQYIIYGDTMRLDITEAIPTFPTWRAYAPFKASYTPGYILKPYFGGNCAAPTTINLFLKYNCE